ncbi:uncharacterized protein [Periplaneta americana]|uniref:uncharacterized protein n=1 Tax=Periplaneta americana TaxID=6978 RepID=UPI0037E772AB
MEGILIKLLTWSSVISIFAMTTATGNCVESPLDCSADADCCSGCCVASFCYQGDDCPTICRNNKTDDASCALINKYGSGLKDFLTVYDVAKIVGLYVVQFARNFAGAAINPVRFIFAIPQLRNDLSAIIGSINPIIDGKFQLLSRSVDFSRELVNYVQSKQ